jgi:hypothetical protein
MSWQNEKVIYQYSMRANGKIINKMAKGPCFGMKIEEKAAF